MGKGKEEEEEIDLLVRPQVVAPFGFSLSLSRISKAIYSPCVAHTIPALIFFSMRTNYGRGHLERNRQDRSEGVCGVASALGWAHRLFMVAWWERPGRKRRSFFFLFSAGARRRLSPSVRRRRGIVNKARRQ